MTEEIDCEGVTEVVRNIFRATRTLPPESFQDWALEEVKQLIPFDACKWGSGVILDGQTTIHNVHYYNFDTELTDQYQNLQSQDAILAKMVETRDRIVTYDRYEITPRDQFIKLPIYTQYAQKLGLEHLISTMVPEPISKLYSVISFFRNDYGRPFSESEKHIKTIITPVLTEARSLNIFINLIQTNREPNWSAAIADAQGYLREVETPFVELIQLEWPSWEGPLLKIAAEHNQSADRHADFEGNKIRIRFSKLHDLVLIEARRKSPLDVLTRAEQRVSSLLLEGMSNKEIARRLDISPKTVGHHLQRVYKKVGVANRSQVIAKLSE